MSGESNAPERVEVNVRDGRAVGIFRPFATMPGNAPVVDYVLATTHARVVAERDEARANSEGWKARKDEAVTARNEATHRAAVAEARTDRYREALEELVDAIASWPTAGLRDRHRAALREPLLRARAALTEGEQPAGEPVDGDVCEGTCVMCGAGRVRWSSEYPEEGCWPAPAAGVAIRPLVMRWDGSHESISAICRWANADAEDSDADDPTVSYLFRAADDVFDVQVWSTVPGGPVGLEPGDWVYRRVDGEFEVLRPLAETPAAGEQSTTAPGPLGEAPMIGRGGPRIAQPVGPSTTETLPRDCAQHLGPVRAQCPVCNQAGILPCRMKDGKRLAVGWWHRLRIERDRSPSTTETATGDQVERVARAMRALRFPDSDWDFDPATEPDPENWPIVEEEREHWREMARAALAAAPATPEDER